MATPAKYVWKPSRARRVLLDGFTVPARGGIWSANPPSWPAKDPADVLDYVLDISAACLGDEGDAVATLDVQVSPSQPGDLTLNSASVDGDLVVLWFSAGFAGTLYTVTATIGTTSGRVIARSVLLPVEALATPALPASVLTDQTGAPIIDQSNNPILSTD